MVSRSQHHFRMRKLVSVVVVALGCGGSQTMEPPPRPQPAEGGFQAAQPRVEGWVNLGVPVEDTDIQRTLYIDGQGGQIGQLLIKGVSGEPEVAQVQIEFMDKSVKRVELNKRFLPGDGQVIELRDERPIQKVTIIVDPDSKGVVEIFGA